MPHGPGNETDIAHGKSNTEAGEVRHDLHGTENDRSQHSFRSEMNKNPMIPIPNEPKVGKDQEKAQSEKDSHSKNRGGKKPN